MQRAAVLVIFLFLAEGAWSLHLTQSATECMFLQGSYLTAAVNKRGYFGAYGYDSCDPAMYCYPMYNYAGLYYSGTLPFDNGGVPTWGDFFITQMDRWAVGWGGTTHMEYYQQGVTVMGVSPGDVAWSKSDLSSGSSHILWARTTQSSPSSCLSVQQDFRFRDNDTHIALDVTITNTCGTPISDVRYIRSVDNEADGLAVTQNTITGQITSPISASMIGLSTGIAVGIMADDIRGTAHITPAGVPPGLWDSLTTDPIGTTTTADSLVSIRLVLGNLAAGASVSIPMHYGTGIGTINSMSPTPTCSRTRSPSRTSTVSPSSSVTPPSTSPSVTPTTSITPSPTSTPSTTPSITPKSVSASRTTTPSTTQTGSRSVSETSTHTPTFSLSSAISPSSTATRTPTPTNGPVCGALPQGVIEVGPQPDTHLHLGARRNVACSNSTYSEQSDLVCTEAGWSVFPATRCLAAISCGGTGGYFTSGQCQPCPVGGYCPGGDIVVPIPGYWSFSNKKPPGLCRNELACIGSVTGTGVFMDTMRCADGYSGPYCSVCAENYYQSYDSCLPCPADPNMAFGLLVGAAACLYTLFAVGIAIFGTERLDTFIGALIIFQQFTLVAKFAATQLADTAPKFAVVLNYLSIFSFEIEYAQPECTLGHWTWAKWFWASLLFFLIVLLVFCLAALLRASVISCRHARRQRMAAKGSNSSSHTGDGANDWDEERALTLGDRECSMASIDDEKKGLTVEEQQEEEEGDRWDNGNASGNGKQMERNGNARALGNGGSNQDDDATNAEGNAKEEEGNAEKNSGGQNGKASATDNKSMMTGIDATTCVSAMDRTTKTGVDATDATKGNEGDGFSRSTMVDKSRTTMVDKSRTTMAENGKTGTDGTSYDVTKDKNDYGYPDKSDSAAKGKREDANSKSRDGPPPTTRAKFCLKFRSRLLRATLIWASLIYCDLCTRVLEGISCSRFGDPSGPLRLLTDASQECFQGDHVHAFPMIVALLIVCTGFPILCFFVIRRYYKQNMLGSTRVKEAWGYLYGDMLPQYFAFQLLDMVTTYFLTWISAFVEGDPPSLLAAGIIYLLMAIFITLFWPYATRFDNIQGFLIIIAMVIATFVLLSLQDDAMPEINAYIGLTVVTIFIMLMRLLWALKLREKYLAWRARRAGKKPAPLPTISSSITLSSRSVEQRDTLQAPAFNTRSTIPPDVSSDVITPTMDGSDGSSSVMEFVMAPRSTGTLRFKRQPSRKGKRAGKKASQKQPRKTSRSTLPKSDRLTNLDGVSAFSSILHFPPKRKNKKRDAKAASATPTSFSSFPETSISNLSASGAASATPADGTGTRPSATEAKESKSKARPKKTGLAILGKSGWKHVPRNGKDG